MLATGGLDQKVRIFSLNNPTEDSWAVDAGVVPCSLVFDEDDAFLVSGAESGSLHIFDVQTAKVSRTLSGHRSKVIYLLNLPS